MEFAGIHTPSAAFVAGLVTSLHCAGMCGPLACWLSPVRADDDEATIFATYQSARLASYGLLGAIAGGVGALPLSWLSQGVVRFLPWALVLFFLALALRLEKRVPKPMFAVRWLLKLQTWNRGRSRIAVAATLGCATPLIPCGPLYFLVGIAALSGSVVRGLEFMLAFGLGTLPLLWFSQVQFGLLRRWLSPAAIVRVQVGIATVAALVIAWRLRSTLGFAGPTADAWVCF